MVTKKNRSEYMKRFKDPKWETYSKCYEDSLKYRLARRLLEHAHKPWFWEGWDSGSESSGRSTPSYGNKVEPLKLEEHSENESSEPQEQDRGPTGSPEPNPTCLEIAELRTGADTSYRLRQTDSVDNGDPVEEDKGHVEEAKRAGRARATHSEPDRHGRASSNPQPPRHKPARAKSQPPRDPADKPTDRDNRQPLGLRARAEKQAETAIEKTHNACTPATAKQVHPSALRAKTRRDGEKRARALDRRRVRSADVGAVYKTRLDPADDPWMTEYMRCFSARSR